MDRMKNVDNMEERIYNILGAEEFLTALEKALDYDTKEEIYNYIIRCYEIK